MGTVTRQQVVIRLLDTLLDRPPAWYICHASSYQPAHRTGSLTRKNAVSIAESVGYKVVRHQHDQLNGEWNQ